MSNDIGTTLLSGMALFACLTGGCGDDAGGAMASGATEGASGDTMGTETASDASATDTSASGSITASGTDTASTTSADDTDSTGTAATVDPSDDSGTTRDDSGTTGDGSTGDDSGEGDPTGPEELCEAPGETVPCDADTTDPFQAIGLNCPGDANEAIPISNTSFASSHAPAWQIARQFGTFVDPVTQEPIWGPTEGEQFLLISTGTMNAPDGDGVITHPYNSFNGFFYDNVNPDNQQLPAPMSPAVGSDNGNGGTPFVNCDHINDCSDSLAGQWAEGNSAANDLLWFQFDVDVPGGTHGFEFDFVYFSAEFPEFIESQFNDIFVVWSNSETYTGNLCFVNDEPCTVRALGVSEANPQQQFKANDPELEGTGFELDGSTGWFTVKASAAPNETLQLTWAVFDMGDTHWDTAVIIDNWRWDCEGCVPSEVNPCGIRPIPT